MTTITFDTLKFARKLKEAGLPETQAEAFAEAFRDATSEELATKSDLRTLELSLKADIHEAKSDMIKWVAGLLIAQAALIAALVKLL
ncbi:DUF1640 domain-containing protein [Thiorhodococcus mannitoliphagus]|uniref:DUF1640 domain-containing protein n=1 Tax=Thiorhodococcus mannitoliphagus TaxID=329406 RepID=A0A6P1DZH5_9GAMM|nr:DUF1640 domain-containing protein [Thiorhodococcus mannitoliphagus]NEX23089.1 DUF1640 domain-containing protein [Thiorhodococcus mannitoliphagus]